MTPSLFQLINILTAQILLYKFLCQWVTGSGVISEFSSITKNGWNRGGGSLSL